MATQRIYSITEVEAGEVLALVTAATKAQASIGGTTNRSLP